VYSSFLKAYNPQREVTERPDDFDNLSLFVSGSRSSSMRSFSPNSTSDSVSPQSGPQEEPDHSEDKYVRHMESVCVWYTRLKGYLISLTHSSVPLFQISALVMH